MKHFWLSVLIALFIVSFIALAIYEFTGDRTFLSDESIRQFEANNTSWGDIGGLLLLMFFCVMGYSIWKYGYKAKKERSVPVQHKVPKDLSILMAGVLTNTPKRAVFAQVIEFARKGIVTLTRAKDRFTCVITNSQPNDISPEESLLLNALIQHANANNQQIYFTKVQPNALSTFEVNDLIDGVNKIATEKGYYSEHSGHKKRNLLVTAVIILVLGILLANGILLLISIPFFIASRRAAKTLSAEGKEKADHVLGVQRYVEGSEIHRLATPAQTKVGNNVVVDNPLLPYAVLFNVKDKN